MTSWSNDVPPSHLGIGPALGERFPDVVLSDQYGTPTDLHAARDGRPALIVFFRSARW